jgi:hypothetical protein
MRFMLFFICAAICGSVYAGQGREAWKLETQRGRLVLLKEYRTWIGQYEALKKDAVVKQQWSLFTQAWAEEVMDCIFAGWPSRRINGSCRSPSAIEGSKYTQGSCSAQEMQCQPLLFGEGVCAPISSREEKQSVFSSCNRKFQKSEKSLNDVLAEVKSKNQEQELLTLFDFVDRICTEGAQKTTGMCRRLEQVASSLKASRAPGSSEIEVDTSVVARLSVINDAARAAGHAPVDCDPSQGVRMAVHDSASQFSRNSVSLPNFVRERSREVACIGGTQGYNTHTYCAGDTEKTSAGFSFRHGDGPFRDIQFVSTDGSRDGTHLYFHDGISELDSHNGKSMMFLLPRLGLPQAVENGSEVSITLTTGEEVVMDKDTGMIIRGALQEGPFSTIMDRFLRPPPNVSYTGRGISIRVDHRFDYPTAPGGDATAEVRQGDRVCQVPRARLWDADGRLLAETDAQMVNVLNTACPATGSQRRFSIEGIP